MKPNYSSLLWGLVLILIGGFAIADQMGYLDELSTQTWMLIFAVASLFFLVAYFMNGIRAWGWLFPACIFAALSGTMLIADSAIADEWIATLVVGSVAVPFVVAFALDRTRWWALIPTFILGFVAFIPPLANILSGDFMGAFIVAMIGLPFLSAYFITPKAWWGIIPGGIMLSIAVMISLSGVTIGSNDGTFAVAIMFVGWALTFGLVWLRRHLYAGDWAKYPALVMGTLACIMFLVTVGLETYWAIGLIVAGLVMVVLGLRPRHDVSVTK